MADMASATCSEEGPESGYGVLVGVVRRYYLTRLAAK